MGTETKKKACAIWCVPAEFKEVTKVLKSVNSSWANVVHKLSVLLKDVPEDVSTITIEKLVI